MQKQVNTNKEHNYKELTSITPSGFFGDSVNNIVELKDFLTESEKQRLTDFAFSNKTWDITESHFNENGTVIYDANVWARSESTRLNSSHIQKSRMPSSA